QTQSADRDPEQFLPDIHRLNPRQADEILGETKADWQQQVGTLFRSVQLTCEFSAAQKIVGRLGKASLPEKNSTMQLSDKLRKVLSGDAYASARRHVKQWMIGRAALRFDAARIRKAIERAKFQQF